MCPSCGDVKSIEEFRDNSLITGIGRFCRFCKAKPKAEPQYGVEELTKSELNKMISFCSSPEKYATGSARAEEKIEYLESIKYKLGKVDLATYTKAFNRYQRALEIKEGYYEEEDDYEILLNEAVDSRKSVRILYKGAWRTIDPYSLDGVYIVAYCHKAQDIRTFRIDRIVNAELSEGFIFDPSLGIAARSKLEEAPNYKGN
mgnify:FL=1